MQYISARWWNISLVSSRSGVPPGATALATTLGLRGPTSFEATASQATELGVLEMQRAVEDRRISHK